MENMIFESASVASLLTAFVKAQAEMPVVQFDSTNPHLKNRYASLGAVISASRPVLAKHGLAISQHIVSDAVGGVGVTTVLNHESGEYRGSTVMMQPGEMKGLTPGQVLGVLTSYFRRYGWVSALGMYADEDTDGGVGANTQQKNESQFAVSVKDAMLFSIGDASYSIRQDGVGTLARLALLKAMPANTPKNSLKDIPGNVGALFLADFAEAMAQAGLTKEQYGKLCHDMMGRASETIGDMLDLWAALAQLANGTSQESVVAAYKALRDAES